MRLSALQINGEVISLEVRPEMTGRELKQQIKEVHLLDEVARTFTGVDIVVGDRLLGNDETVADAGLTTDDVVSMAFKQNMVKGCNKDAIASFCSDFDSNVRHVWLVVELPGHETQLSACAFRLCNQLAKVTIPDSVTHIGRSAFAHCSSLASLTLPNSVTHIGNCAFK